MIVSLATLIWNRSSVAWRSCYGHWGKTRYSSCGTSWPYLEMTGGLGFALKPADGHSLQAGGLFLRVNPRACCPDHLASHSRVTLN